MQATFTRIGMTNHSAYFVQVIINLIVEVCNGPDKACEDFTILTFIVPLNVVFWNACNNKCSFCDREMLIAAELLTCIGVLISFNYGFVTYSVAQYMTGALILFVSAEVLEGTHSSFCRSMM